MEVRLHPVFWFPGYGAVGLGVGVGVGVGVGLFAGFALFVGRGSGLAVGSAVVEL